MFVGCVGIETQNKHSMKIHFENTVVKMGVILVLTVLLLIPSVMVENLIIERQSRQEEAIEEVSAKHAGSQELTGPVLTIPYTVTTTDAGSNATKDQLHYLHILPEKLTVKGKVTPEERKRGLFSVIVYQSQLRVDGEFTFDQLETHGVQQKQLKLDKAFVTVGISDLKGVRDQVDLRMNGEVFRCGPGVISTDVIKSGLNTRVPLDTLGSNLRFSFNLSLNGSESLTFAPIGKETNVQLQSPWKDPSFDGFFLPISRTVNTNGFSAHWKALDINRNFPQVWTGRKYSVSGASFGVKLQLPVDVYQKSMRVAKYAILFIVLTFLVFFFVEVINRVLIHPIQYILVGLALVLFYVLLLGFSEQVTFNFAYILATGMTVLLIALYSRSLLKSWSLAGMMAGILSITYGFIFIIIQLQDFALLFGALGVFAILATTMYFSRKVDWFGRSTPEVEVRQDATDSVTEVNP